MIIENNENENKMRVDFNYLFSVFYAIFNWNSKDVNKFVMIRVTKFLGCVSLETFGLWLGGIYLIVFAFASMISFVSFAIFILCLTLSGGKFVVF